MEVLPAPPEIGIDSRMISAMETDLLPFVSVVIPAFNEAENIVPCLRAIAAQDYPRERYEVIVADNGSADNTVKLSRQEGARVAHAVIPGPAAARNAGAGEAGGEIIAFIDCDCTATPHWLRDLVEGFREPQAGAVAGEILIGPPRTDFERLMASINYLSQAQNLQNKIMPFAATANVAYRRDVFERLQGFDERLRVGEDADLSWRLQRELGLTIAFRPNAVVYHVRERESTLLGFCKQRFMHGRGIVSRRKKYPDLVKPRSFRTSYWDYRALAKRGLRLLKRRIAGDTGDNYPLSFILFWSDISYALGRLYGSFLYRVWYV
jgi:cellulose synthase/poly-beta-1,6-N-acetylglucosamine synthase-like glycosyltransferase